MLLPVAKLPKTSIVSVGISSAIYPFGVGRRVDITHYPPDPKGGWLSPDTAKPYRATAVGRVTFKIAFCEEVKNRAR